MTVDQALMLVVNASPLELLAFALIAGYRGWWYFGPVYKALEKDRDEWKAIAQEAVGVTQKQADQNKVLLDLAAKRR